MTRNRFLVGLALVAVIFLAAAASRYSPDWFGSPHDDTLYFSAAKSIAAGRGYRMPSVPGEPPQTKYPALYPALLSLAWRVTPVFPDNLVWAWRLNLVFALSALLLAAALARQLGASRTETLVLASALALHPFFIYWSNHLVSDLLFSALALGAVVVAQRELDRDELRWGSWLGAAALLALACMTRTVGVAFVAGVAAAAAWRGRRLAALGALAGAAPAAYGLLTRADNPALAEAGLRGFRENLIYYTSYVEHWKECVPSTDILLAQASKALTEMLKHPAVAVFQIPATGTVLYPLAILAIAITVGIVVGIVARAREHGVHAVHFAALFYVPIVLLWNYLLMGRFWLPFLMLFLAGASHELMRIATMAAQSWRKSPAGDRVVIAGFGSAVVGLVIFAAHGALWRTPHALARIEGVRARLAEPKREAYRWLEANSSEADTVISYDDAALYLYSNRRGMRAFTPLTDSYFAQSQSLLDRDLEGITDTAAALGAHFWVASADDFEMTHAPEQIRERLEQELAAAPLVFSSRDGKVRIYDVSGMPWVAQGRLGQQASSLK